MAIDGVRDEGRVRELDDVLSAGNCDAASGLILTWFVGRVRRRPMPMPMPMPIPRMRAMAGGRRIFICLKTSGFPAGCNFIGWGVLVEPGETGSCFGQGAGPDHPDRVAGWGTAEAVFPAQDGGYHSLYTRGHRRFSKSTGPIHFNGIAQNRSTL
jgi:hypothetical protein